MRRLTQVLIAGAISAMPLVILTGCGLRCHGCDGTTLSVLSQVANVEDAKYTDCAGPGAILRCGLNTVCWPTECVLFKLNDDDIKLDGNVVYYHGCGSVDSASVKSLGIYTNGKKTCTLCDNDNELYIECTNEKDGKRKTTAYTKPEGCLGWLCIDKEDSLNLNFGAISPGLLKGCYSCNDD